jgi:nitric oxide reductase activation protein
VEQLGDPFAIAGFHSNTRHDVRYLHIKGYGEHWGDDAKGRLAAMQAGYSTRMGAAMRHAAHYLEARQAVKELDRDGIFTYCISLDPKADEYVSGIFGRQYTVIDNIQRLPEKLPELFLALTK